MVRPPVKKVLEDFVYEANWKVNLTTDGAATMVDAHQNNHFPEVGLNTNLVGTCINHMIHLFVNKSMKQIMRLDEVI